MAYILFYPPKITEDLRVIKGYKVHLILRRVAWIVNFSEKKSSLVQPKSVPQFCLRLHKKKVSHERKRRRHDAAAVLDAFATATNPFLLAIFYSTLF